MMLQFFLLIRLCYIGQYCQSIFLLLVGLALIIFLFVPVWEKQAPNGDQSYRQSALYVEKVTDLESEAEYIFIPYTIAGALSLIAACIALFSIGLYKKRKKQMFLSGINTFLIGGTLIISAYWASSAEANILTNNPCGYQIGLVCPAIALFFNSLAIRFIRKDEKLVRSMDRLR